MLLFGIAGEFFMNISLTPELEKFVFDKVNSGFYTSASEVVRESLRLLNTYEALHQQRLEQLNNAIEKGLSQLEKGHSKKAKDVYKKLKAKIQN